MKVKIKNIGLSARAYNCLKNAGVNTIEEMAKINPKTIRNCGVKTKNEIEEKINYLKERGYYSEDFINEYIKKPVIEKDYVDDLTLSVRAKNTLRKAGVSSSKDLINITEEGLKNIRSAGKLTINEIILYIKNNYERLFFDSIKEEMFSINIEHITNFSGYTKINDLPINEIIKTEFKKNNIESISDLLTNKINNDNIAIKKIFDYFHNIAYGPLILKIADENKKMSVILPFQILELQKGNLYRIADVTKYIIRNYNKLTIPEMINVKLYLYWLNIKGQVNLKDELLKKLDLNEREKEILCNRNALTLSELGKKFDITRERIRQIEIKAINKIEFDYVNYPFRLLDYKKTYLFDETTEDEKLLLYLDSVYEKNFEYISNERCYFPVFEKKRIINILNSKRAELEENGFIVYNEIIEDYVIFDKALSIMNMLRNKNYIFKKITKREQIKYVIKAIGRPINVSNNSDINDVIYQYEKIYGIKSENDRALEAAIMDSCVRIGPGTYYIEDGSSEINESTLNEIVKYVKEKKIVNSRDIFFKFEKELKSKNIKNDVMLYRILKEQLDGTLFFHGVSAVISSDPELSSWGIIAIRDIKKNRKPLNKLEFMVKYSLTEAVYNSLPINYEDIIVWNNRELFLKSLVNYRNETKEKIEKVLKERQILSFVELKKVLNDLEPNILKNNYVSDDSSFSKLLEIMLDGIFIIDKNEKEVKYLRKRKKIEDDNNSYKESEELTI